MPYTAKPLPLASPLTPPEDPVSAHLARRPRGGWCVVVGLLQVGEQLQGVHGVHAAVEHLGDGQGERLDDGSNG